jgi:hypothetical protein
MSYFQSASASFQPVVSEAVNQIGANNFVGARILPLQPVPTFKGTYALFSANQFDNDVSKPRAAGSQFAQTSQEYGSATFQCQEYGIENSIDDLSLAEASTDAQLDLVTGAATSIARNLMVGHELRVAAAIDGAGFNGTAATAAFSDATNAKPINDINLAVQRLNDNGFFDGLQLVIEQSLFQEMVQTDDMRSLINGSGTMSMAQDQVARILNVDGIIVCGGRYNSAVKGQSASRSKVWSTSNVYVAQIAGGPLSNGGIGRTLTYSARGAGAFTAETFRTEQPPASVVRVRQNTDEIIINTNAGEKITSA